jgi:hypothetical protein
MAVEEDSDLGRGASGNEAAEGLASERESAVRSAEGGVKETGVADESADKAEQQKRAIAESNKTHLSVAGQRVGSDGCDTQDFTVPRNRGHWTFGHILRGTLGQKRAAGEPIPPPPCSW